MSGNNWGGRRANQTGRPKGSFKPEGVRAQHQVRAYDDEWQYIQRFAKLIKYGDRAACEKFLREQEAKPK